MVAIIEVLKAELEQLEANVAADAAEFFPALKSDLHQIRQLKRAIKRAERYLADTGGILDTITAGAA